MAWLIKDVNDALIKYPKLSFNRRKSLVSGFIEIINPETNKVLEDFNIQIKIPHDYPKKQLPIVKEIGYKIPRGEDRHVYENPDGQFCLTTPLQEFLICRKGISFSEFLNDIVYPFLATQMAISLDWIKEFPQGEYSHGTAGILEDYIDFLGVGNVETVINCIKMALNKNIRNTECFCGSNLKVKNCHEEQIKLLKSYGKSKLKFDLTQLQQFKTPPPQTPSTTP